MNKELETLSEVLRQEFDRSFASAAARRDEREEDFIEIRVGGEACALRLSELGGLMADARIVPLPGRVEAFLGVVGSLGAAVPVYDLRTMLGRPRGESAPKWLALLGKPPCAALAFDENRAHLRVRSSDVIRAGGEGGLRFAEAAIRRGESALAILCTERLLERIREHARERGPSQE